MKNILVFNDSEERLEQIARERDCSVAEIIDSLLDNGMDIIDDLYPISSED